MMWVQAQGHTRLCAQRDLSEHDVVLRIMRKDNYLIGMLNKGCLALNVPLPGMRKQCGPLTHLVQCHTVDVMGHGAAWSPQLQCAAERRKAGVLMSEL